MGRVLLAVVVAWLLGTAPALASNEEGSTIHNLHLILTAIRSYREHFGRPLDDIRDRNGRPILSWRVRLLPLLEGDDLHRKFDLNEPWDGPYNRSLLKARPRCYRSQFRLGEERTAFMLLRGPDTLFPPQSGGPANGLGDPGKKVWVVEADDDHAAFWTQPADLWWDGASPIRGLAGPRTFGPFGRPGALVGLSDGSVRFVPAGTPVDLLRPLVSASSPAVDVRLPPWEVLFQAPANRVIVPALLLGVVLIAVSAVPAWRQLRGATLNSGEVLLLALGGSELVFLLCWLLGYRPDPFPSFQPDMHALQALLIPPRLTGVLVLAVAFLGSFRHRERLAPLGAALAFWSLGLVLSFSPPGWPEEAFLVASPPVACALSAVVGLSLMRIRDAARAPIPRLGWHWAGLLLNLVPLAGVVTACGLGSVDLSHPFAPFRG